jgi:tetratricopeptide (TPR) repeat protein
VVSYEEVPCSFLKEVKMARQVSLVMLVAAVLFFVSVPAFAAEEGVDDAVKTLSAALSESQSDSASVELLKDFLVDYPDTKYTPAVLSAIAYYQGESMGDRDGAISFVRKHIDVLQDADHIRASKVVLAELYDKPEDRARLEPLARELVEAGGLSFNQYSSLITTALGAEDWKLALDVISPALATASPESVRADYPGTPDERVEERSRGRMVDLDVYKGWALANTGDAAQAFELFKSAQDRSDFDYFGLPDGMLYVYWGKALQQEGDLDAALAKLLPMALWGGSNSAVEAVKAIYESRGGDPADFEDYLFKERLATAKTMDSFSAADYNDNLQRSKDLMGKVTLVAFWFPT